MQNNEIEHLSHTIYKKKKSFKWLKLSKIPESINLPKENMENIFLFHTGFSNYILDTIPKEQATKLKIIKSDSIKLLIKSFHRAKETINRVKRQFTKWEKTFQTLYMIISRIYKELIQLNTEKTHWSNSGQKIWIDISPKKIYKWWPIGISKILYLVNHHWNANQNNSEISPHTC